MEGRKKEGDGYVYACVPLMDMNGCCRLHLVKYLSVGQASDILVTNSNDFISMAEFSLHTIYYRIVQEANHTADRH